MDKTIVEIYNEILNGLNNCFETKNFFKANNLVINKENNNNYGETFLAPYFYDESMNVKLYLKFNIRFKYISLEMEHKYKNHRHCIYKGKLIKEPDDIEDVKPIDSGFKELDNWLYWVKEHNKDLPKQHQSMYDLNMLIHMFEIQCKEYFLSAEKYFKNKKIVDQLLYDMKKEEHKIF